jgi:hypothetical protein
VAASDDTALKAVQDRLARLEADVAQAGAGAPSNETGARLTARLNDLQGEIEAMRSAPPDLSGLENGLAELRRQVEALSAEMQSVPREPRIASLETKLDEIGGEMRITAALGPAVAADALAAAVDAGRPFASELAALQGLGADTEAIAALKPHAETGLPTLAAIRSEFETEVARLDLTRPVAEGTGTVDRLLESARGLVEVRPAHPTEGADPAAVVTRVRGALAAGNLKTALVEWKALPEDIRAETADWAKTAEARVAADDLVARLRADALSRLGSDE